MQSFSSDTSSFSVKDANGRQISLLNNNSSNNSDSYSDQNQLQRDQQYQQLLTSVTVRPTQRRKYHCSEPGCNKSFTTRLITLVKLVFRVWQINTNIKMISSGHLARHHRIHTGEKNFQCMYPGCPSRFSRQDNMMQHYRTHLSPKGRWPRRSYTVPTSFEPRLQPSSCYCQHSSATSSPVSTPVAEPTTPIAAPILPQLFASRQQSPPKLQPLEPSATDRSAASPDSFLFPRSTLSESSLIHSSIGIFA